MNESDKDAFVNMVAATLELYGRRYTMPESYELWFQAFKRYDYGAVRSALQAWALLEGKSQAPTPADIVRILQRNDGWIDVEEAWSIVSKALFDEAVTVFWTPPMQTAFGVALSLVDDKVAARMAFKEVYARELSEARERGDKPHWQASPGTSREQRTAAIEEALRLGRITRDYAVGLLPGDDDVRLIAGLNVKRLT